MGQIITEKCIRLNYLYKFLGKLKEQEGYKDTKILLSIDESEYSIDMISGDTRQVIIEDVAYDSGHKLVKFYCITNHNPDFGEVPEKEEMELYEFFSIMYWPLDERRNVFRPFVAVDWNEEDAQYDYAGDGIPDGYEIKDPNATIKHIYVRKSVGQCNTCIFFIDTTGKGFR